METFQEYFRKLTGYAFPTFLARYPEQKEWAFHLWKRYNEGRLLKLGVEGAQVISKDVGERSEPGDDEQQPA